MPWLLTDDSRAALRYSLSRRERGSRRMFRLYVRQLMQVPGIHPSYASALDDRLLGLDC
jgi:hypothetical protein